MMSSTNMAAGKFSLVNQVDTGGVNLFRVRRDTEFLISYEVKKQITYQSRMKVKAERRNITRRVVVKARRTTGNT